MDTGFSDGCGKCRKKTEGEKWCVKVEWFYLTGVQNRTLGGVGEGITLIWWSLSD